MSNKKQTCDQILLIMNATLGLYDRDHSEKEYWIWESDGSEANFTHWNSLRPFWSESNDCVNLKYNDAYTYQWNDYYNAEWISTKTTMDWTNQNCNSNTFHVLCQRMVAYDDCKYAKENFLKKIICILRQY